MDQEHNSGSDRENSNPRPDLLCLLLDLFPFLRRHVHRSHVFQHFLRPHVLLAFRAASTPFSKYTNCRSQIAAFAFPRFSIANPQQVFPLAKVALEAHALRDLEGGDDAALDWLAALSSALARLPCVGRAPSNAASEKNRRFRRQLPPRGRILKTTT
jgi:hypothetical protein